MMRSHRNRQNGFTLIEILISLVILMIGIVGIISLFPVGMKNVSESNKDSTAGALAQSLNSAMTEAMRRPNTVGDIILVHDGLQPSGTAQTYTFALPATVGVTSTHPMVGMGTDTTKQVFQLGMEASTDAVILDITAPVTGLGGDPTEPLRQYSFQFIVTKPPEANMSMGPGLPPVPIPLYEYKFLVYRSYEALVVPAGTTHPRLVREFTTLIAGTGL